MPGRRIVLLVLLSWVLSFVSRGQDLSQFRKSRPFTARGSFHSGINYLESQNPSIDPLGYHASLNLQFSVYGVLQIPVTLSYGNYGSSINTLNFRRFGMSPSYKNLKIHGGYRSYQLSPYLMSGMTVLGGGVEYSPKKFYLLGFAGRIVDRYNLGGDFLQFQDESIQFYQRNAYGVKLGFGKSTHRYSLMALRCQDMVNTGTLDSLQKYHITPKDNFILGAEIYQQYFRRLTIHLTGAASVFTNNRQGDAIDANEFFSRWIRNVAFLTTLNTTSRYAFAYDGRISYRIKSLHIGLKYQHIDPNYTSLGVAFMQTNFDNLLVDVQGSLLRNKLVIFSNFGIQQVHRNGFTGQRQRRIVQNTNINWNFNKSVSLQMSYNDLAQNTDAKLEEVADSLQLTVNSRGWNMGWTIKPGRQKEKPHVLNAQVSRNTFSIIQNDLSLSENSNITSNLGYRYILKKHWNLSASMHYHQFTIDQGRTAQRYGLVMGYGRNLTEKWNVKGQGSYKLNFTEAARDGYVLNAGLNLEWRPHKAHQIYASASALWRQTQILSPREEWRWRLNYSYSF